MKHAGHTVFFRPPFAHTDGETGHVDDVEDLAFAQNVGVIANRQFCVPIGKFATISKVCRPHSDPDHVFAHGWLAADDAHQIVPRLGAFEGALDIHVLAEDMERLPTGFLSSLAKKED